ncbi:MAG: hypothetical protein ACOCXV_02315, partial [Bacteroidota bacterium]
MDGFEKEIQKKLQEFEVAPPEEVWHAIESRLDRKKTGLMILRNRIAAAAAILLLIVSATTWLLDPLSLRDQQISSNNMLSPEEPTSNPNIAQPVAESSQNPTRQKDKSSASSAVPSAPANKPLLAEISRDEQHYAASVSGITTTGTVKTSAQITALAGLIQTDIFLPGQMNAGSPAQRIAPLIHTMADNSNVSEIVLDEQTQPSAFQPNAFGFSVFFAPQQSYRHQFSTTPNPTLAFESEIMTFATGLNASYQIHKRWEIFSGIGYNRIGQRVHDIASFSHPSKMPLYSANGGVINEHPQSMSTSMGGIVFTDQSLYFADISSTRIITLKGSYDESVVNLLNKTGTGLLQYFEYLQIPIGARYKIINRTLAVHASAAINTHYLLSGDVFLVEQPQHAPVGRSVGVNRFNFSGTLGLGFSYPVSNHFSMHIEPAATMFLRPIGQVRNLSRETYP